jgi:hypothetical protein
MARFGWFVVILTVYALHQDFWLWRQPRPFVFGFLPAGLAYHGAYCLAVAGLMWALTRYAWPSELDELRGSAGPAHGTGVGAADGDPGR